MKSKNCVVRILIKNIQTKNLVRTLLHFSYCFQNISYLSGILCINVFIYISIGNESVRIMYNISNILYKNVIYWLEVCRLPTKGVYNYKKGVYLEEVKTHLKPKKENSNYTHIALFFRTSFLRIMIKSYISSVIKNTLNNNL